MGFTLPSIDWQALKFGQPDYLWLLVAPSALLVVWLWQVARRRADVRRYLRHRAVPVRETFSAFGGLLFWLCLLGATGGPLALRPLLAALGEGAVFEIVAVVGATVTLALAITLRLVRSDGTEAAPG